MTDYYPYGMDMPGRTFSAETYRYGYQGSEKDNGLAGGSGYTTFFRSLDPRIGRWQTPDPKVFPWPSPYCSMDCNPIALVDPWGAAAEGGEKGQGQKAADDYKAKTGNSSSTDPKDMETFNWDDDLPAGGNANTPMTKAFDISTLKGFIPAERDNTSSFDINKIKFNDGKLYKGYVENFKYTPEKDGNAGVSLAFDVCLELKKGVGLSLNSKGEISGSYSNKGISIEQKVNSGESKLTLNLGAIINNASTDSNKKTDGVVIPLLGGMKEDIYAFTIREKVCVFSDLYEVRKVTYVTQIQTVEMFFRKGSYREVRRYVEGFYGYTLLKSDYRTGYVGGIGYNYGNMKLKFGVESKSNWKENAH